MDLFFFFKQKTAYEMRISDWSSDVCSSDLVVAKGTHLARPELAHSVHVEVAGLQPDRPYYYRFTAGGERSLRGRARTLPAPGAKADALKFGVAGCQHFEAGFFGAYRHLAREDLAFVYHYGDFIYEYSQDYLFDAGLPTRPVRKQDRKSTRLNSSH